MGAYYCRGRALGGRAECRVVLSRPAEVMYHFALQFYGPPVEYIPNAGWPGL